MDILFLLQFACCIITGILALMLAASRLQLRWIDRRYETSRWLLCLSMAGLSLHYVLQMKYGFRAKSDEIGTVVNLLFYTPVAFIISYAIYNVVCQRAKRLRFITVSIISYALILGTFGIGRAVMGSLRIGAFVYAMLGLFAASLFYCIPANIIAIHRHRRVMEEDSGVEMLQFDSFAGACYIFICVSVLVLTAAMLYRPLLLVVGPMMILSLFAFTVSFIGYGFNITPADEALDDAADDATEAEPSDTSEGTSKDTESPNALAEPDNKLLEETERVLTEWSNAGGFRESNANMASLSAQTGIPRKTLNIYFERHLNCNFRTWLSELRFAAAQEMLHKNPHFSNDTVSSECGFSSHGHLYKIFKAKTGMTPRQWKDSRPGATTPEN